MDLDETSYIEEFHFADKIVFSGLLNKKNICGLGILVTCITLLPHQAYPYSLLVLLLCNGVCISVILSIGTDRPEQIVNSVDPDQTPRSAASDLGLYCLRFTKRYSRHANRQLNGLVQT